MVRFDIAIKKTRSFLSSRDIEGGTNRNRATFHRSRRVFFAPRVSHKIVARLYGGKRRCGKDERCDALVFFERRAKDGRPRGRVARAEKCFLNAIPFLWRTRETLEHAFSREMCHFVDASFARVLLGSGRRRLTFDRFSFSPITSNRLLHQNPSSNVANATSNGPLRKPRTPPRRRKRRRRSAKRCSNAPKST